MKLLLLICSSWYTPSLAKWRWPSRAPGGGGEGVCDERVGEGEEPREVAAGRCCVGQHYDDRT